MQFLNKSKKRNYDVWSSFSWYVPGTGGMFTLLGMLLFGVILGSVAQMLLMPFGKDFVLEYGTLISYPLMFVPAFIYAGLVSKRNELFDTAYALDSNNFAPVGGPALALLCVVGTIAMAFDLDAVVAAMPEMPAWLEEALNSMVKGKFWVNFLSVSILAPICEEWLCRGLVLRGLLNSRGRNGKTMKPWAAIAVSALFFAVIHLNPWQAVPAFAIGCLMGYVYYKTGSLKLTMLMHFANNTFALMASRSDMLRDCETWTDAMPAPMYRILFAACLLVLVLVVTGISRVRTPRPEGASDEIRAEGLGD